MATYPGCFLLVSRDPTNGKPKVQFDSASRNYVIKGLEKDKNEKKVVSKKIGQKEYNIVYSC
ncbi:MAG: hypothetical protein AB1422_00445 [bacterium]